MTTSIIRRKHPQRGYGKCNVPNCPENAKYYNPNSSFKYCLIHFKKLNGKIIFGAKQVPKLEVLK